VCRGGLRYPAAKEPVPPTYSPPNKTIEL